MRKPIERGNKTKDRILQAGIEMWLKDSSSVSANAISKHCKITHGTVLYHFPEGVKDAVAQHAVNIGNSRIIVELMGQGHPAVENLSPSERSRHFKAISIV